MQIKLPMINIEISKDYLEQNIKYLKTNKTAKREFRIKFIVLSNFITNNI
jgi:S-adenosylmethionine synthetase